MGGLKCTTLMDTMNKIMLPQDNLTYKYKGDQSIKIGVLGMVDDNIAISQCGVNSLEKNALINSFIESNRLKLSKEKSVVLHVGKKHKCKQPCPKLKVHKSEMNEVESVRYLGDVFSASGALRPRVEDRRSSGWGKLAEVEGILSELPQDHKIEIGMKLHEAKIHNGILFNSEAWSNVTDGDMERLEQVGTAALKALVAGHSKCTKAFYYLEFGTLMIRHKVMIRRILYHHQ